MPDLTDLYGSALQSTDPTIQQRLAAQFAQQLQGNVPPGEYGRIMTASPMAGTWAPPESPSWLDRASEVYGSDVRDPRRLDMAMGMVGPGSISRHGKAVAGAWQGSQGPSVPSVWDRVGAQQLQPEARGAFPTIAPQPMYRAAPTEAPGGPPMSRDYPAGYLDAAGKRIFSSEEEIRNRLNLVRADPAAKTEAKALRDLLAASSYAR